MIFFINVYNVYVINSFKEFIYFFIIITKIIKKYHLRISVKFQFSEYIHINQNHTPVIGIRNLYFYIRTANDITPYNGTDVNWMNILIDTDGKQTGFEGYDFAINRAPKEHGKTSVERSAGGWNWEKVGEATMTVDGNKMTISVPLSMLGLSASEFSFGFKVADNVTNYKDIMDYYVSGDSAPIGRLRYSYGY